MQYNGNGAVWHVDASFCLIIKFCCRKVCLGYSGSFCHLFDEFEELEYNFLFGNKIIVS